MPPLLFEVPLLAIVNEVYFRNTQSAPDYAEGRTRLAGKIRMLGARPEYGDCRIADYGTRRRFSKRWHEEVILMLKDSLGPQFAGTSNVFYAYQHGLTPLGTMAHEYLQACQALGPRLRDSQIYGFEMWAKEYRGDLGIALSDVYGMKAFLRDFDRYFCKLFDGVGHDSGDPFDWASACSSTTRPTAAIRAPRSWCSRTRSIFPRCSSCTNGFAGARSSRSAWARTSRTTSATSRCRS